MSCFHFKSNQIEGEQSCPDRFHRKIFLLGVRKESVFLFEGGSCGHCIFETRGMLVWLLKQHGMPHSSTDFPSEWILVKAPICFWRTIMKKFYCQEGADVALRFLFHWLKQTTIVLDFQSNPWTGRCYVSIWESFRIIKLWIHHCLLPTNGFIGVNQGQWQQTKQGVYFRFWFFGATQFWILQDASSSDKSWQTVLLSSWNSLEQVLDLNVMTTVWL